ncbi:unnamed protein product [Gemmataceae bacterium]|nr:unnamed protein product [Gemmataceae bacterium]VTU01109.1 unnamed protein product [Gemmataceae bacterium]
MTTFGKVLIFLNMIAAGAFAYFALLAYHGEKGKGNGRQAITAAGLKHVLLVDGLPLGDKAGAPTDVPGDPEAEIPFEVTMAGGYRTKTVGKKLLDSYFKAAPGDEKLGGGAVPNQLAEVKRVKAKIDADLAAAETPDAKLLLLAGWLLLQPEVYEERQAIQKLIAEKKVEDLEKLLNDKFAAVLDAPKPLDPEVGTALPADEVDGAKLADKVKQVDASRAATLDDTERRNRLAHLLVHLSPDENWQKRVAMVVGLRRFAAAIISQAERFTVMAMRIRLLMPIEQADYQAAERTQKFLAINRTTQSNNQAELKAKAVEQEKRDADFAAQRATELKAIQERYARTKAQVDEMLVKQTAIEAALFEVQREVAITLDEVYRLEEVLEARERDLLGLPRPQPAPKAGN